MPKNWISKLQINNFRNLSQDIVEFSPNINCIIGDNGNGKTNLLEVVYYLIHKKSFRKNTSFSQFLSIDSDELEILFSSLFKIENNDTIFSGKLNNLNSTWYLNNEPSSRKLKIDCIFINPFDSFNFHTTASFRRNLIDSYLSDLSSNYKRELRNFNKVLKQRNNLLSDKPPYFREMLESLNENLISLSIYLINERLQHLENLNNYLEKIFKEVFSLNHHLKLEYSSKFNGLNREKISEYYESRIDRDINAGRTIYAPHLDDYIFKFDGVNSFEYCSLGQQKMSYLSLIFSYIELFNSTKGTYPIVLIDDVSGELDSHRWKNLIEYLQLKNFQVLITTANQSFKHELKKIDDAKFLYLEDGKVI